MSDLPAWALEKARATYREGVRYSSTERLIDGPVIQAIARTLVAERAAERDACAKECDRIAGNTKDFDHDFRRAAGSCAAAIRNQEPDR